MERCSHRSRRCSSKAPGVHPHWWFCGSSFSNVAPEMAEPPKTSEQRIDAAVQLLRPRGPRARGRSAGRAGCSHRTEGLADREPQAPTNTPNHAQPSVKPPRADSPPQAEMLRRAAPNHPSAPPPWLLPPALR